MKERPILFSTQMVKALLAGRKTMTRRVMNPQPLKADIAKVPTNGWGSVIPLCPYGKPGDLMWVRETHAPAYIYIDGGHKFSHWVYKADDDPLRNYFRWSPSIFMFKRAARIWLQIEDVYIERLNDISEPDSIAEGVELEKEAISGDVCYKFYPCNDLRDGDYVERAITSFYSLWKSIHGEYSWKDNPYVWVVKFKVVPNQNMEVGIVLASSRSPFPEFPLKQPAHIL